MEFGHNSLKVSYILKAQVASVTLDNTILHLNFEKFPDIPTERGYIFRHPPGTSVKALGASFFRIFIRHITSTKAGGTL